MPEDLNSEHAHRLQEKFDFYSLALTFAILGLSVQTFKLGRGKASDVAELLGWALLLGSGLIGLVRLSWQPQVFRIYSESTENENTVKATSMYATESDAARIFGEERVTRMLEIRSRAEKAALGLKEKAEELEEDGMRKYRRQRNLFVAGLVALMISRGLPVFVDLFGYRLIR
jgi:hypothetical protein